MYTIERLQNLAEYLDVDSVDRILAEYFLSNLKKMSHLTLKKCIQDTGVSKASIHRFYSRGGFNNFKALTDVLTRELAIDNVVELNNDDIKLDVDNGQLKIIEPENDYMPIILHGLDASIPCYNYTLNKYLMFILKPDEEYDYIYHKYNYGKVDEDYNSAVNKCYKQVLLGQTDNIKYYSQSLNKLLIKQNKENMNNV